MSLDPGYELAHYEILEPIGKGGMGEVYRAKDSKLGRDVAIKVLPDELARDSERLRRFQREAKVLAALNHPNIASIYGLEHSGDTHYLVLELVPGETLAERIARGPIPVEEALEIAKKIAEALEEAHEHGIVHRDLKPANIKLTEEGIVKVLDFGLAKAFAEEEIDGGSSSSMSPTITRDATRVGVILGTASYMSPEQAKGKRVDKRCDVFAFGAVLYEMLTGKRAFPGDDVSEVLASVIKLDPDWGALDASPSMMALIRRCLDKDPKRRWRDIGDVKFALEERDSPAAIPAARQHSWWLVAMTAVAASVVTWLLNRPSGELPAPVTRSVLPVSLSLREYFNVAPSIAISPNGRNVAYVAVDHGTPELRLRSLDTLESRVIPDSDGARMPFFSPDGQWLGFFARGAIRKAPLSGGAATRIAALGFPGARGASWGIDGSIVFTAFGGSSLARASAEGGAIETLTTRDLDEREKSHRLPEVLPGGEAILFTLGTGDIETWDDASIALFSRKTGRYEILIEGGSNPRYAASGHLLYARAGSILAVPFDLATLELRGTPVTVVEDVATSPIYGHAEFAVSRNGTLVYAPGGAWGHNYRIVWADRHGAVTPIVETPGAYADARLSPDETALAVTIEGANPSIWIYDMTRGTMTRLASGFDNNFPAWAPDGLHISFRSSRTGAGAIYAQPTDGSGPAEQLTTVEPIATGGLGVWASAWAPDGKSIVFVADLRAEFGRDLWIQDLGEGRETTLLAGTESIEALPALSPDGRWLAFRSNESGRSEIYVQRFPEAAGKRQVSTQGGDQPRWSRDGREIYYWEHDTVMAVAVDDRDELALGGPQPLFSGEFSDYDVASDGRFVLIEEIPAEASAPQLVLVQNWFQELERLVPTGE